MSENGDDLKGRRAFLKSTDIAIILLVLVLSVVFLFVRNLTQNKEPIDAVIYVDGEKYEKINLLKEHDARQIEISSKLNVVIEVEYGKIRFVSSECPDKICIHSGVLSKVHDTAACMPADVAIVIE